MLEFQGSLLGGSELTLNSLAPRIERTPLARGAWVDVARCWVEGTDQLFAGLIESVAWRAERRTMYDRELDVPRLVAFFADCAPLPNDALCEMRSALNAHYQLTSNDRLCTTGMCLYRDGRDSVAWHGDRIARANHDDVVVAIVSLGAPRALLLRPRGGGNSLRFLLGAGDLLVMGGACQRTWEHSVPKTKRATGPRMSVQFRPKDVR